MECENSKAKDMNNMHKLVITAKKNAQQSSCFAIVRK